MDRTARVALRLLPALVSLGLLAFVLRSADVARSLSLVQALGWGLPLLLLPNLAATLAETSGWWLAFGRLGARPPFPRLLLVRISTDALLLGLPSGSLVSESLQPYLLKRRCGVPLESGIVASVMRKFLVVCSHGLFLSLATLLAWPLLDRVSRAAIHRGGLPWLLLATGLSLAAAAAAGALTTVHGRVADRVHRGLDRLGGRWIGSWLERNAPRFRSTDAALARLFGERPSALALPMGCYLAGWLIRSLETLVFLRLVGVSLSLPAAMVIETSLVLVRAAAVPVPGGIGVQDLGYLLCLRALGVPDVPTVGAAFVLLKRGKDLAFVVAGFLLIGAGRQRGREGAPALG